VRNVEAGMDEDEESSLPVGESRIKVCRAGVEFWERKVERRFVRSIVWDIVGVRNS